MAKAKNCLDVHKDGLVRWGRGPMWLGFLLAALLLGGLASAAADEEDATPAEWKVWRYQTPLDFLDMLQKWTMPVTIEPVPTDWIKEEHLHRLVQLLDSRAACAPVVSCRSSFVPLGRQSFVGNEALFLLEGYMAKRYPPSLSSIDADGAYQFKDRRQRVLAWWKARSRNRGAECAEMREMDTSEK